MNKKENALIICCGAVLMLSQYILVREVGSTFFSTEIITIMSVVMSLIGPSIAYFFVDKVSERVLLIWSIVTFIVLSLLPFGLRYSVALMRSIDLELPAMVITFLVGSLLCSSFFAVFLPKIAGTSSDFNRLYRLELLGALLALGSIFVLGSWMATVISFWVLIVLVIHFSIEKPRLTILLSLVMVATAASYPSLDKLSACQFYKVFWDKKNPRILKTEYSAYQRIDVVEDDKGKALFLDGVPYYEYGDLHWFNYYIAELPGKLVPEKKNAVIVGSGTLASTGYLVRQGFDVTTVEIDQSVYKIGKQYFSDLNKLKGDEYKLVIGDARRYFRKVPSNSLDIIVLDIPAPYHLQTALLYVPSFFSELKRCLKPNGILTVNTCSFELTDPISASIAKSASSVFGEVLALQSDKLGLTVLYCSKNDPIPTRKLKQELAKLKGEKLKLYDNQATRFVVSDTRSHTRDNLCALLLLARYELPEFTGSK